MSDISALDYLASSFTKNAIQTPTASDWETNNKSFESAFQSALDLLNTTSGYSADSKTEKINFALGNAENSHDMPIAGEKASTVLQYTVTVRDKILEAYKEIMNIQI